ncbi:MAG TPA: hypothetical protein PKI81_07790, partial [bacterium]|nr:hypothetical protein [bacterium]
APSKPRSAKTSAAACLILSRIFSRSLISFPLRLSVPAVERAEQPAIARLREGLFFPAFHINQMV